MEARTPTWSKVMKPEHVALLVSIPIALVELIPLVLFLLVFTLPLFVVATR